MKICHVCICTVFWEKYAYHDNLLPKYHRLLGHEVTIIATTDCRFSSSDTSVILSEPAGVSVLENGIKLIRLKNLLPSKINKHLHICCGLYKTIDKESPDFIFVHSLASPNYRMFVRYKRNHQDTVIVFDNHADKYNTAKNKLSRFWTSFVIRNYVAKKVRKISNCFYGVTPSRCQFLQSIYGVEEEKIKLLPMGADDEEMRIDEKTTIRNQIRLKYNIKEDDFLIVTGGRIDKLKNIHIFAKAVNDSKNKHIKLLVFGSISDDLKDFFKKIESEKIIVIGWVNSSTVYDYFYAADLIVFPGLHSVLWEQAVASGTPCAFNKIDGFEHVDLGGNCLWLIEKTSDYYKNVIEELVGDNNKYIQLYRNASSEKSMQFLYSRLAKKVLDENPVS